MKTGIRTLCLSIWLAGHAGIAFAQPSVTAGDPVCGFIAGPHYYFEEEQVKQGLSVDLLAGKAEAGKPVVLRFLVNQKPRNFPTDGLQVEHEKLMHVLGVRDDLTEFFHIHPVRVGPGLWEAQHTFAKGGHYKLWSDVKWRGTSYSIGHGLLSVMGGSQERHTATSFSETVTNSGYCVALTHADALASSRTNQIHLVLAAEDGKTPELDNFLGAPIHLVIIKEGLSAFIHAHPEPRRPGELAIRFNQTFPEPGIYKLFAQFRPQQANLSANGALLAEFRVKVL